MPMLTQQATQFCILKTLHAEMLRQQVGLGINSVRLDLCALALAWVSFSCAL